MTTNRVVHRAGLLALFGLLLAVVAFPSSSLGATNKRTSEYSIYYTVGFPTAGTRDSISNTSWAGIGFDAGWYVMDRFDLGLSLRWQRFSQHDDRATYNVGTGSITGEQKKALNMYPLLFRSKYEFAEEGLIPYVALGLGPYYGTDYRVIGNFSYATYGWQFGLAPEVGVFLKSTGWDAVGTQFSVRYDAGLGTDAFKAFSAFSISIGARAPL